MARGKPIVPPDSHVEIPFPAEGLDESRRHHTAHSRHTPAALNVRGYEASTDRLRGGSRPGLSRYLEDAAGSDAVQDLNHLSLAYVDPVGVGDALLGRQTTAGTAAFTLLDTGGSVSGSAGTAGRRYEGAVWDDDGNCYVATQDTGAATLYLQKVNDAATVAWTVQPITFRTTNFVYGMAVEDGVLYVLAANTTAGTTNRPQLFRFNASDGTAHGGTALWKDYTDLSLHAQTRISFHNLVAYSNGILGLLVLPSSTGAAAVRLVSVSDGSTLGTVALTSSPDRVYGVAADAVGNFYALAEHVGNTTTYLQKVSSSGSGSVTYSKSTASSEAMTGVCYDAKNNRLGVVGLDVRGSGFSFATVDPATGDVVSSSDMGGETGWYGIAYDGEGGFVLGRGTGTNDFSGVGEDLVEDWAIDNTALYERYAIAVNHREGAVSAEPASRRRIRGVVVCGGTVKSFFDGELEDVTSGTTALSATADVIFSAQNGLNLFFADGVSTKYYNSTTRTVSTWTPTAGSLPSDSAGNRPRLICTWRARTVLSGLLRDPQNWFMSAVNNPFDYDYAPQSITPTQAVAGNNSPAGQVGDLINTLIPFTDDVLIFGGDHTIWMMQGDPMSGGQIDLVTDTIGTAWGRPWCKAPDGTLFFFASRGGVYRMVPGQQPVRISQQINKRLRDVDLGPEGVLVRMAWDDRCQGLYVFLSPLDADAEATHYYWDARKNAWWPLEFGEADHNPLAVHVFDGDDPGDRAVLLGGRDGYVRKLDEDADDDDGEPIASAVTFGPLCDPQLDEFLLKDLTAILSEDSGVVTWKVRSAESGSEAALTATPRESGEWSAGRNATTPCRVSGHALYVELSSEAAWSLEVLRARVQKLRNVRGRGI